MINSDLKIENPVALNFLRRGVEAQLHRELEEAVVIPKVVEYERQLRALIKPYVESIALDKIDTWHDIHELTDYLRINVVVKEIK